VWNNGVPVTSANTTYYAGGGMRYVTNTAPDGSRTISVYQNGRLASSTRKDPGSNQVEQDETDLLYYGYRYFNASTGSCAPARSSARMHS
jgi:hypothetical protein